MARVLIHCASYPADLSAGSDLRFLNLCRQIAMRHESYLVCFGQIPDDIEPKEHMGVHGYDTLPPFPREGRSFLRHLRLTNTRFLERSMPDYLEESRMTLERLVKHWNIDMVVCMVPSAAEMLTRIDLPKLLDYCDSRTLTYQRMLDNRGATMPIRERFGVYLKYFRQRQRERALVQWFDRTTTISEADRDCLAKVAGVGRNEISVIPNGVADSALQLETSGNVARRSVVFWGNLDFPPNFTAVDYFNREIFLPYLADKDIDWHIIGKGAGPEVQRLAQHPRVYLHGFVEDLYEEIASHGVMVNPMVEGSGLKNKVLEAFACRLPVVSTSLGFETSVARPGEHYLVGDDPASFADAVKRCLEDREFAGRMTAAARQLVESEFEWNGIGERLDTIIREICR